MSEQQRIPITKLLGPVSLIVFACVGLVALGFMFGMQSPRVVYVTQTQPASVFTQTAVSYSMQTLTSVSAFTQSVQVTVSQAPPFNYGYAANCNYPWDPYWCAQALGDLPPQTVNGFLVQSGNCWFLHGYGQDYALYNVPANSTMFVNHEVQAYGYVYLNWPQSQLFPPYQPFTYGLGQCMGTPVWLLPPYFQLF